MTFCSAVLLYLAGVSFRFAVIVDAHEQQAVGMLSHLCRILLALDLIDGGIGILVELQLYDDGG